MPTTSASESSGQIGQKYPPDVSAQMTTSVPTMLVAVSAQTVSPWSRRARTSAGDRISPASPARRRDASQRENLAYSPTKCAAATRSTRPRPAGTSARANVSTWRKPTTSLESTHRYQIGTEISSSAHAKRANGISASGQASRRWPCCFQNAGSRTTFRPRFQKPLPPDEVGGSTATPSSSLARAPSARASCPTANLRPISSGTTSGVIAKTSVTVHPAISRVNPITPSTSSAT